MKKLFGFLKTKKDENEEEAKHTDEDQNEK
jgi:hypothetical protein